MSGEYANWQERQRQGRVVVWACKEHRTSPGEECPGCADQGELFTHAEAAQAARSESGDEPALPTYQQRASWPRPGSAGRCESLSSWPGGARRLGNGWAGAA